MTYAKKDPDGAMWGQAASDQKIDIYVYNKTKEWDINTSETSDEQRIGHSNFDCDEEEDFCVYTQVSGSYHVQKYYPGPWTVNVWNDKSNQADVKEFRILLTFK